MYTFVYIKSPIRYNLTDDLFFGTLGIELMLSDRSLIQILQLSY